jgi:hypothetical protein
VEAASPESAVSRWEVPASAPKTSSVKSKGNQLKGRGRKVPALLLFAEHVCCIRTVRPKIQGSSWTLLPLKGWDHSDGPLKSRGTTGPLRAADAVHLES